MICSATTADNLEAQLGVQRNHGFGKFGRCGCVQIIKAIQFLRALRRRIGLQPQKPARDRFAMLDGLAEYRRVNAVYLEKKRSGIDACIDFFNCDLEGGAV
jgi:hypothetical protein